MATIKFYPHKPEGECKIYVRLKIGRQKDIRQSTGLTIKNAKDWKKDTQLPKSTNTSNKNLSRNLKELNIAISDSIDSIEKSQTKSLREINGKWLKKIILDFTNEAPPINLDLLVNYAQHFTDSLTHRTYKRKGVKYKYDPKTIAKYQNITNHFIAFDKHKGNSSIISDIDVNWANDFLTYLTDINPRSINTKGKFITRLKTILKNAETDGIKINPKYRNISSFEDETIVTFLTFEEIDKIIATKMPTERLQIAKDWFIISCYTAQRISDLFRFTKRNIQTIDGGKYLVFKQYKTKQSIELPIHYHVEDVLKRYDGNFPPNFSKNEQSNRSILSSLIKEVCRISRIIEKVKGRYNGVIGVYPKWKLISNHTGRRSFASNFYNLNEWSPAMIMNITGHQTEKSFRAYIDKEDNTLSRKGRALFDQMKDNHNQLKNESNLKKLKKA